MSLRARVFAAVLGILFVAVLGAWLIAGGGVLRSLTYELVGERVATAVYVAQEIEKSNDTRGRARDLARDLDVDVRVLDALPDSGRYREVTHGGRTARIYARRRAPVVVEMESGRFLAVRFPTDVEGASGRMALGLLLLAAACTGLAWLLTLWVLRPIETMAGAMERVARGGFEHRVPEEDGLAGALARPFNLMAAKVAAFIEGQRRLIAGVSHELRTPLARMRILTEILRDQAADPRRLDDLDREIMDIDALVGELVENARLEMASGALRKEPTSLQVVVEEALSWVDLQARPVTLEVAPEPLVLLDRARVARALRNVLTNVVRYTPLDCPVTIRGTVGPDGAELSVIDSGPGVPADKLDRLFEPFFRVDESRSKGTGGTGLGLMLVRQIARAHGGEARATHAPTGGLSVTLRIPLA